MVLVEQQRGEGIPTIELLREALQVLLDLKDNTVANQGLLDNITPGQQETTSLALSDITAIFSGKHEFLKFAWVHGDTFRLVLIAKKIIPMGTSLFKFPVCMYF